MRAGVRLIIPSERSGNAHSMPSEGLILESLLDPVIVLNGTGDVVRANAAAYESVPSLRSGKPLPAGLPGREGVVLLVDRARRDGVPLRDDGRSRNGLAVPGLPAVAAIPLGDRDGHVVVMLRDLLPDRLAADMRALQAAGEAVQAMARDTARLLEPLVLGAGGSLHGLREAVDTDRARDLVRVAEGELERLGTELARLRTDPLPDSDTPPKRVAVNLHEILDEVIATRLAAVGGNWSRQERFDPSLPPVLADRALIRSALEAVADAAAHELGRLMISNQGARAAMSVETSFRPAHVTRRLGEPLYPHPVMVAWRWTLGPGAEPHRIPVGLACAARLVGVQEGAIAQSIDGDRRVVEIWLPMAG